MNASTPMMRKYVARDVSGLPSMRTERSSPPITIRR